MEPWVQEHEFAVAGHNIVDGFLIAGAFLQLLPDDEAQIVGKRRIGVVDGLILADKAAKSGRDLSRARLELWVLQLLLRIDRKGRRKGKREEDGNKNNRLAA